MKRIKAQSLKAEVASQLVEQLQHYFVQQLEQINEAVTAFEPVEWFRDEGLHGGGVRYVATDSQLFNRGSVNVSQVNYDNDDSKKLASATALSTIVHPENPFAPSVHMHISWTEMKNGSGYWRMMADLNPAIEDKQATAEFSSCLESVDSGLYLLAQMQGDQYFYIPALKQHRGVSHFYLEEYNSGELQADAELAQRLGQSVIDCYIKLFKQAIKAHPKPSASDYQKQRAYHSLYLFQVLTLDRGTTSGLLIHDQNDIGIMGSLPAQVDKALLISWKATLSPPQDQLLEQITQVLPDDIPCRVDDKVKQALATVVREHYREYPQALTMQAQGHHLPSTVKNHEKVTSL